MANTRIVIPIQTTEPDAIQNGVYLDSGANGKREDYPLFRGSDDGTNYQDLNASGVYRKASQISSVTVTGTSEATLFGDLRPVNDPLPADSLQFSANYFAVGDVIRLRMGGVLTKSGAVTLNIRVKLGSVEVVSTGTATISGTLTNVSWKASADLTLRAIGASGSIIGSGIFLLDDSGSSSVLTMVNKVSTPDAEQAIDTTSALTLDITAQWSASNSITSQTATVEIVG